MLVVSQTDKKNIFNWNALPFGVPSIVSDANVPATASASADASHYRWRLLFAIGALSIIFSTILITLPPPPWARIVFSVQHCTQYLVVHVWGFVDGFPYYLNNWLKCLLPSTSLLFARYLSNLRGIRGNAARGLGKSALVHWQWLVFLLRGLWTASWGGRGRSCN